MRTFLHWGLSSGTLSAPAGPRASPAPQPSQKNHSQPAAGQCTENLPKGEPLLCCPPKQSNSSRAGNFHREPARLLSAVMTADGKSPNPIASVSKAILHHRQRCGVEKTWCEGQPPLPLTRCVTLRKLLSLYFSVSLFVKWRYQIVVNRFEEGGGNE